MSLDDSVIKNTEKRKFKTGQPTEKQIAYIKSMAKETGVQIKKDDVESFEKASETIERLQKMIKPTQKQVDFAKKLSEEKKIEIPKEARESKFAMSKWIDGVLKNEA